MNTIIHSRFKEWKATNPPALQLPPMMEKMERLRAEAEEQTARRLKQYHEMEERRRARTLEYARMVERETEMEETIPEKAVRRIKASVKWVGLLLWTGEIPR